ncbi:unnamed protein product, partial [Rotaria socialis]
MARFSCGVQCTRIILFSLNILFFLFGLTLLGFGIYVKVSNRFEIALPDNIGVKIVSGDVPGAVGILLITVAVFTILLSAFGCCGALFKNRVFLYLYTIILGLLVIVELAAFIITLYYRVQIRDSYKSGFRELFIEIYSNNHTDLQHVIEDIERNFKCCGIDNVTDYYTHNYTVPASCYKDQDFHKPIFKEGCANAAITWLWNQIPIIGGVLGVILLIEIFGIASSISLEACYAAYNNIDYLLNGGAGVGKSTLIKAVYQSVLRFYNSLPGSNPETIRTAICAPTDKAASLIDGMTLHSFLSLPINQCKHKLVKLDSGISNKIGQVDARLQQIMKSREPFGGVSVIVLGDFNQLRPIDDKYIFQFNNSYNALVDNPLWSLFELFELMEIMRQNDDKIFAIALSNIAKGMMTLEDINLLKLRIVSNENLEIMGD